MPEKVTPQVLLNYFRSVDGLKYEQFTIDFIEEETERFESYVEGRMENTYDTIRGALRYRVDTILEVMRPDAIGRPFFEKLLALVD